MFWRSSARPNSVCYLGHSKNSYLIKVDLLQLSDVCECRVSNLSVECSSDDQPQIERRVVSTHWLQCERQDVIRRRDVIAWRHRRVIHQLVPDDSVCIGLDVVRLR